MSSETNRPTIAHYLQSIRSAQDEIKNLEKSAQVEANKTFLAPFVVAFRNASSAEERDLVQNQLAILVSGGSIEELDQEFLDQELPESVLLPEEAYNSVVTSFFNAVVERFGESNLDNPSNRDISPKPKNKGALDRNGDNNDRPTKRKRQKQIEEMGDGPIVFEDEVLESLFNSLPLYGNPDCPLIKVIDIVPFVSSNGLSSTVQYVKLKDWVFKRLQLEAHLVKGSELGIIDRAHKANFLPVRYARYLIREMARNKDLDLSQLAEQPDNSPDKKDPFAGITFNLDKDRAAQMLFQRTGEVNGETWVLWANVKEMLAKYYGNTQSLWIKELGLTHDCFKIPRDLGIKGLEDEDFISFSDAIKILNKAHQDANMGIDPRYLLSSNGI